MGFGYDVSLMTMVCSADPTAECDELYVFIM